MTPPSAASRRGLGDDRGVVGTIVLFPLFFAVVFMFVQGVFWQNDRQAASAAADYAAQAVALHGFPAGEAQSEAVAMAQAAGLRNVQVSISRGAELTVAELSGSSPGIIIGTSISVSARAVAPTEGVPSP